MASRPLPSVRTLVSRSVDAPAHWLRTDPGRIPRLARSVHREMARRRAVREAGSIWEYMDKVVAEAVDGSVGSARPPR